MSDQNSDATLREFVAVMVHDLNNPIAALGTNLGYLETLVGPSCSAEMAETLSDLRMLCDILRRLTGNLGFVGQNNRTSVRHVALDVMALAIGAIERLEPQARASEVSLDLDKRVRTGQVFVESDPTLCERALDNLLAFAIERSVMRSSIVISLMKNERVGVRLQCTTRPETSDLSGHVSRSRELQVAHGRGLSLLCARLAAEAAGGRLDVRRDAPNRLVLDLDLHTSDKQIA
jgi:signal transduction histidine kinase